MSWDRFKPTLWPWWGKGFQENGWMDASLSQNMTKYLFHNLNNEHEDMEDFLDLQFSFLFKTLTVSTKTNQTTIKWLHICGMTCTACLLCPECMMSTKNVLFLAIYWLLNCTSIHGRLQTLNIWSHWTEGKWSTLTETLRAQSRFDSKRSGWIQSGVWFYEEQQNGTAAWAFQIC